MSYDKFLIAPLKGGLVTDTPSWRIPRDACSRLNNVYVYKGTIRKRWGTSYMGSGELTSRLRAKVGTTTGSGDITVTVPGAKFLVGQMFSVGDERFTVVATGTPGTLKTTGSATLCTFNTTTGELIIEGAGLSTDVYYYPADSVMGITYFEEGEANNNPSYAFDTQFIYKYDSGSWNRSGTVVFKGSDSEFFSSTNWLGASLDEKALYVTNFNATIGTPGANDDPLYSFDGTTWSEFRPVFRVTAPNTVTGFIQSARFAVPFKGKLLYFGTIENVNGVNKEYQNRCRWCWDGSPYSPVQTEPYTTARAAWLEVDQVWIGTDAVMVYSGGAGWADAATSESLMGYGFIRDKLIIYFERSTWEIVDTGSAVTSFSWQRLNNEIGSESPFSTVDFDNAVLTVGSTGVHLCNGSHVEKIDNAIEQDVFEIRNTNAGRKRVWGIRDYFEKMVYWTFPSTTYDSNSAIYSNKLLVFNYAENAWSTFDDCVTCFGHYEQLDGSTWSPRQVLAGNQHGFITIVKPDVYTNAGNLVVTNMVFDGSETVTLTIKNHTLTTDEVISLSGYSGITLSPTSFFKLTTVDADTITITVDSCTGTYTGGGIVARVSRVDILTKQFNPYIQKGTGVFLARIDFIIKKTSLGAVTVDYFPSSTSLSMNTEGESTGALLGDGVLETSPYSLIPMEAIQERLKHPMYFQSAGEFIQLRLFLSDVQLLDGDVIGSDFRLEGMMLYTAAALEW